MREEEADGKSHKGNVVPNNVQQTKMFQYAGA